MTATTNNETSSSKTPSHIVYHVRDREGGDPIWTRIGAGWPHNDGKGFNIQTLDGRLILRVPTEKSK